MKKLLIIGLIVGLVLVIVGGAGVAYARIRGADNNVPVTITRFTYGDEVVRQFSYGPGEMMQGYAQGGMMGGYGNGYGSGGMMGGYSNGYGPGGMMGRRGNGYGPGMMGGRGLGVNRGEGVMHDYMITAFAASVDLTSEQVETRLADGETLKEIAIAQGITEDQLPDLITQVRQAALDQAVADGVLTQAQADLMLEHMNNYMGPGFGPGFRPGFEGCPMMDGDEAQQP
jgi:hypothetical protein